MQVCNKVSVKGRVKYISPKHKRRIKSLTIAVYTKLTSIQQQKQIKKISQIQVRTSMFVCALFEAKESGINRLCLDEVILDE